MAAQQELGKKGEDLAAAYLTEKGFSILHRNWRSGQQEVDLVALKEKTIHFVEVKFRSSKTFGNPEGSVNRAKFRNLKLAAEAFLRRYPGYRFIQFDILSITQVREEPPEYFWIGDIWF